MLVELNVVDHRSQAVVEVLNDEATVTDVARRCGVARQTVHEWRWIGSPRFVEVHFEQTLEIGWIEQCGESADIDGTDVPDRVAT